LRRLKAHKRQPQTQQQDKDKLKQPQSQLALKVLVKWQIFTLLFKVILTLKI
jgi:hypothetical protein